eukprot:2195476-Rhodomonas_salina.1
MMVQGQRERCIFADQGREAWRREDSGHGCQCPGMVIQHLHLPSRSTCSIYPHSGCCIRVWLPFSAAPRLPLYRVDQVQATLRLAASESLDLSCV